MLPILTKCGLDIRLLHEARNQLMCAFAVFVEFLCISKISPFPMASPFLYAVSRAVPRDVDLLFRFCGSVGEPLAHLFAHVGISTIVHA